MNNLPDKRPPNFPIDLNPPTWLCQNCRHPLVKEKADSYANKFCKYLSSRSGKDETSSVSNLDQSFVVVLPNQSSPTQGFPPRPSEAVEDSFVVLPQPAASMYASEGTCPPNRITVLTRAFDIATTQTKIEKPLCMECMRVLSDKLEQEAEDVNLDIKKYEDCLRHLQVDAINVLSEAEFLREKVQMEEEERRLEAAIIEAEKQCADVDAELEKLELESVNFDEQEEKYWQELNAFEIQLTSHQEERDAVLAKIECSEAQVELLKSADVLKNAFPIGPDGEFGTINNFRLGRLPNIPVEWDEINAAWGQACLLLHTMADHLRPEFPYRIRILPMGSYSRIMDTKKNTYELFGPVNLFWSTRYDKAMILFLTCLNDFAEFANSRDRQNKMPAKERFKLPYKIEKDRVGSYCIAQSFTGQENWAKALKYTLCDLKFALYWFVANTHFGPLSAMQ